MTKTAVAVAKNNNDLPTDLKPGRGEPADHLNADRLAFRHVFAYGILGLPLAFAALPLYIYLPRLYSEFLGIPLAALGLAFLLARLADALIDPLLGNLSDRWQRLWPENGRRSLILLTLPVFALGFWWLLNPTADAGLSWLAATLTLTYIGFSLLTITYQAWSVDLADSTDQRSRLTAAREGWGLIGVVLATALPTLLSPQLPSGLSQLSVLFMPILLICTTICLLGTRGRRHRHEDLPAPARRTVWLDLRRTLDHAAFRRLLMVFVVNGIATALPATLVMFYVADVLGAEASSGKFLAAYFVAGLCGLPFWVRLAHRCGTLVAWRNGMLLACLAFSTAPFLGPGDNLPFYLICIVSGLALGADLVLPGTHLADLCARDRHASATYFGIWNFATKLNLALAAGIALPLLAAVGYQPGSVEPENNTTALALFYGVLPLVGKLAAAALLHCWQEALAVPTNEQLRTES